MTPPVSLFLFCLLGLLPAVAIAGPCTAVLFLSPLLSGLQAAIAATLMFVTFGSLTLWITVVAAASNGIAGLALLRRAYQPTPRSPSAWDLARMGVLLAAVAWPLMALTAPIMGYDTEAIWMLHAALVSGGHHEMLSSLVNPGAVPSNPDYPPLVPAAVAVVYKLHGSSDQYLGVWTIAILNSMTLGLCAEGLLQLLPARSGRAHKAAALLIAVLFLGAVDGCAGVYAVNGYADLLWAGAAGAGIIYGLVLPVGRRNLAIAVACANVAGLTKNEGLTIAVALALLVAVRYWRPSHRSPASDLRRAIVACTAAAGGGLWYVVARLHGLSDQFFARRSGESFSERLPPTAAALWGQLHLLPVALAILLLGMALILQRGQRLTSPSILVWAMALYGLAAFSVTYVVGSMEIHWWLATSVNRAAIFINLCLLIDMTVWSLQGLLSVGRMLPVGQSHGSVAVPSTAPERLGNP